MYNNQLNKTKSDAMLAEASICCQLGEFHSTASLTSIYTAAEKKSRSPTHPLRNGKGHI